MAKTEHDGQDPGQEGAQDANTEEGHAGQADGGEDRIGNLEARLDLLNSGISELRNAVLQTRNAAPAAQAVVDEDIDDGEPLTGAKVSRIVQKSIASAVSQSTQVNQRQQWDDKAKSDFPLADPKFLREFQKQWNDAVNSGLDAQHPKAIYQVAKQTAAAMGTSVKQAPRRDADVRDTAETPNRGGAQAPRTATAKIPDDDPRVRFYMMRGNRTKEQVAAFKTKLATPKKGKRA